MIKVFGVFLLAGACFGPVYGQAKKQAASADAETVKQLEREWLDAEKAGDTVKIGSILADDWVGLQSDGSSETKQQAIDGIKSGADKMLSADLGPMSVKLIGPVAIVQGSDVEKSSSKGKDTSGKWVWMDVFVKRDGRWQVVRSQVARLP
ncbi:MAG TPA: nuclear transport factor 2 family protein [Bryobacteraceae bacterium]|nr:nuclear transport factor 2 family protein [Bryobacteraceae bacterium]